MVFSKDAMDSRNYVLSFAMKDASVLPTVNQVTLEDTLARVQGKSRQALFSFDGT